MTRDGPRRERAQFRRNHDAWEDWSRLDPLWAIVTDDDRRDGRWDEHAFFASGEATIAGLWSIAAEQRLPVSTRSALDFGCGVGRLTRALGTRVDSVVGLDISQGMIDRARTFHRDKPNVQFDVHDDPDLSRFGDGSFDVVCSLLVLQHIPSREDSERFLGDLSRVLAPGGLLMLQLVTGVHHPESVRGIKARLRVRTRLAGFLRHVGVPPEPLGKWLGWKPEMPMVPISDQRAREILATHAGEGDLDAAACRRRDRGLPVSRHPFLRRTTTRGRGEGIVARSGLGAWSINRNAADSA